jgi:hypothetical protein
LGYAEELIAIKSLFQYQEERLLIAAMERLLDASPKLPGAEPMAEFRPRDLLEHVMAELEERGEYQESRFLRYWSPERVGRVLTRMSVFKRKLAKGIHYTITEAGLRELKARYEPSPVGSSAGSACSAGIFEDICPPPTPTSTTSIDGEGEDQDKSSQKEPEIQKEALKLPQGERTFEAFMEALRTDTLNTLDRPSSEISCTTCTTCTKPHMKPLNQNEALENPLPKNEPLKIPLSQVEELILRIVEEEGSIGILLLKQKAEAKLGRKLEGEEYQATLRSLDHKELIRLTGEVVSIPKTQMASQETLAQALEKLGALPPGAEFSPEELSSRFDWSMDYTERILRLAERDGIVFQTPSGRWRRG